MMSNFKLESHFEDARRLLELGKVSGLTEVGKKMTESVKRETPVKTGDLRKSVGYKVGFNQVEIGAGMSYAPNVELGSSRNKANSFLKETVLSNSGQIEKIIASNMSKLK